MAVPIACFCVYQYMTFVLYKYMTVYMMCKYMDEHYVLSHPLLLLTPCCSYLEQKVRARAMLLLTLSAVGLVLPVVL